MDPLNLTDREKNAPAGMSTLDGGAMSGYNPALATPTPTPAPAPMPTPTASPVEPGVAPQPTIGETLEGIKGEALRIQDILNQRQASEGAGFATSGYEDPYRPEPFDEAAASRAATRNQMKLYQAEIDATNQVYDQLLNEARIQGQGRLGSQRAGAARGGLLGSDFAASQKDKVQGFNTDINRGIQAERTAAIGSIMGTVRSAVQDEIRAKREAREAGASEYMNYLANRDQRRDAYRQSIVSDMLAQGYDPSQFSEEELVEMLQGSGLKSNDIIAEYAQQKAASEAAAQGESFTLSAGQRRYDSAGNLVAEGQDKPTILKEGDVIVDADGNVVRKIPKTYKPGTGSEDSFGGFSNTDEQTLLGGGWSQQDIGVLAAGVAEYGLQEVIKNERAAGATESEIAALQSVYGQEASVPEFLTKDYFRSTFSGSGLEEAAAAAGFGDMGEGLWNLKDVDTEAYLNSLESSIQAYRKAGYNDKEILEMMQ